MQHPEADRLLFNFQQWSSGHWKIPFALAFAVHLAAFLLLLVSPYLHPRRPLIDVQTVNLFTAQELEQPKPARAQPKPPPPPPAPAPKIEKPAPAVVPIKPAPAPIASKPAVSLKPLKMKEKLPTPKEQLKAKESILERKLRQVQARVTQERAEENARKEVATALDRIRQSLATAPTTSSSTSTEETEAVSEPVAATGGGSSGSAQVSEAKRRYYAELAGYLEKYWTLPESHDWKESLEVTAVLWFRADGTVVKRALEEKSENEYFNRFAQFTLDKVERVPPIPSDLPPAERQDIIVEGLGFKFHPSGIY